MAGLGKTLGRGLASYYTGGASEAYFGAGDAERGRGAAIEAAQLQEQAIRDAAAIQSGAYKEAIPLLQGQFDYTRSQFDPYTQAGAGAITELQQGYQAPQGASLGGIDEILNQIMGGEAFGGLVEERQRGVQGQLAAGGLTRSGRAIEEAAAVPTDIAFQLENLLYGRQQGAEQQRISGLESLVSGGRGAVGAESVATNAILSQLINAITGKAGATAKGLTGAAEAKASGILGGQQAEAAGIQNLLNLSGSFASEFFKPSAPSSSASAFGSGQVTSLPSIFNQPSAGVAGFN